MSSPAFAQTLYVQTMAQYNQWMNRKVYQAAATLTEDERRADRGAFFKSVHATLAHLVWADSLWMSRFLNKAEYAMDRDTADRLSFEQMSALRASMDRDIVQWALTVDDGWFAGDMTWTSATYQKTFTRPQWLLAMQLFNHQTHHRGQVTTLLTQYGLDVGATDLPVMPEFEHYGE